MASCGASGPFSSQAMGICKPSPFPQATTPSGYEARPKIEVVKPKARGNMAGEAGIGNKERNGSSRDDELLSRETESPVPCYNSQENQGEVVQKGSFDQAFPGNAVSNGDNISAVTMQLGCSDGSGNAPTNAATATSLPANMGLIKPMTNYAMDYWNGEHPAAANMSLHGPRSCTDYWYQDEKELKRQKRKEANRESARRSRMRKQAECDELAEKVQALTAENESLRREVERLGELSQQLSAENVSLLETLQNQETE